MFSAIELLEMQNEIEMGCQANLLDELETLGGQTTGEVKTLNLESTIKMKSTPAEENEPKSITEVKELKEEEEKEQIQRDEEEQLEIEEEEEEESFSLGNLFSPLFKVKNDKEKASTTLCDGGGARSKRRWSDTDLEKDKERVCIDLTDDSKPEEDIRLSKERQQTATESNRSLTKLPSDNVGKLKKKRRTSDGGGKSKAQQKQEDSKPAGPTLFSFFYRRNG